MSCHDLTWRTRDAARGATLLRLNHLTQRPLAALDMADSIAMRRARGWFGGMPGAFESLNERGKKARKGLEVLVFGVDLDVWTGLDRHPPGGGGTKGGAEVHPAEGTRRGRGQSHKYGKFRDIEQ
jgi:hypothetical protein